MYKKGDEIYKYQLIESIGSGQFGTVWKAMDMSVDKIYAIKIIQTNESVDNRLIEGKIGSIFDHANVVPIRYADIILEDNDNKVVILVMPYYENGSILKKLNQNNFLNTDMVKKCGMDICKGLEYMHSKGFYHSDIKPGNILIGENEVFVISDYGITCHSPEKVPICKRGAYLPHTAPETYSKGFIDEQTDIYQLGITLYRLANNITSIKSDFVKSRVIFEENVREGKVITINEFLPHVPNKLARIILKAVNVDKDVRYGSVLELRRDFEKLHLKGSVSCDEHGNIIFIVGNYIYRYEVNMLKNNKYNFIVYKKNTNSNKETKCNEFCFKNITCGQINKKIKKLTNSII